MPQLKSKVEMVVLCTQRVIAIDEHVSPKAPIRIASGVVRKASEVKAIYEACLARRTALAAAQLAVKAAQAAVAEADAQVRVAEKALAPWVVSQFGVDSAEAAAFGFVAKTRAVRPVADKARSAELGRATRKARGTLRAKEKAKIKGELPAIVTVPDVQPRITNGVTNAVVPHVTNGVAHP